LHHSNMKAMLASNCQQFHRWMDWLIYHLTGDALQ
jgi:hypothetical protein